MALIFLLHSYPNHIIIILSTVYERMNPMVKLEKLNFETKKQQYNFIATKMTALVSTESDFIANMANGAALLWNILKDINWSGFYLWNEDNKELVLAPFCGMPACTRLKDGKGVCNAAVIARETVVVKNVHEFPGHIACDSASNSEIVVPMIKNGKIIGVLDIDAPIFERFDDEDRAGLEKFVSILLKYSEI